MAAITQNVQKLIRNLKDSSKVSLQCGALTYIRSNAEKLESTSVLKEEEYCEICRLVIDAITSADLNTRSEATKALYAVLKHFKRHSLKFFESALQLNRKKRLKIFQFLETVDDSMVSTAAQDPTTLNFMSDCMYTVQTSTMEWLLPSSCTDNLQRLAQAESRSLTDDQELEEQTINYALALLQRLYKIASVSANYQSAQRFDTLLMDKVVTLAYMGHKKQRAPAIKLLYEAIDANLAMHIKTKYLDVWARYKIELQGPYCTRMSLLVKACELDWASQWSISIRLLGTDLHRGATLINNLLSVEERAFKSTDTNVRRQAFVSWKLLVDNFALEPKELATARRIKLLCVPLTAKNSKSELIALTKLEVWWYLITKLYPNITKFADPVMTQFLNFCFGPLGDTPLLSAKADVIASPGKRFYKTKVVAIDALLQLIVRNQEDRKALAPILEERLTNSIPDELFKECYKAFLHSVGEAIVIISQLHENEMKNREEIIKVLLTNLISYVQSTSIESKAAVYNEFILVVTELQTRALGITCVNNFICEVVVPELSTVAADLTYPDGILVDLLAKILTPSIMKTIQKKHCEAIKALLWQALKPKGQTEFHSGTLQFLGKTIMELKSVPTDETGFANCFELWFAYAEIAYKYVLCNNINEGTGSDPSFKTIEAIIHFPFAHMYSKNSMEAQIIAANWKDLYKQFECRADVIPAVKPNEIFDNTSKMIKDCLAKNEKCYRIAVYCLDALLSTINYQDLLAQDRIPTIVRLVADLTAIALHEGQPAEGDCALKALSSLLITVYGHSPEKALAYLRETGPTVELMLKTDAADFLIKEVTSTWETIVSILRGLSTLLDANFLRSYKEIILSAVRHSNAEIAAQGEAVIAMKGNLKETAKAVLLELDQEVKKTTLKIKSDKAERATKQVKLAGSFMNRKIPSPRPILGKQKEREEKKLAPLPPEPESQDYVVIQSELKLDVNRLTEHQKESLKRRRDDIPAMYNDLSQSSSQDTQDLQQWFDGKAKQAEPPSTAPVEKEAATVTADGDPNKENKIDKMSTAREEKVIEAPIAATNTVVSKPLEEKCIPDISTSAALVPSDQDLATLPEPAKELEKLVGREKKDLFDAKVHFSPVHSPLVDHSYVGTHTSRDKEPPRKENTDEIIAKKLDFESREEYPDEKETADEHQDEKDENEKEEHLDLDENEKDADESASCSDAASINDKANKTRRSSKTSAGTDASIAQSVKRAHMHNRGKPLPTGRELRNSNSESQDQNAGSIQTRGAGKSRGSSTRRSQPVANPMERGVKRKATSDSESDGSEKSKRLRRKSSRSPSGTPNETENAAPASIDKRTETEMSRLRIDMVFDGPLPSRRRSKATDSSAVNDIHGKRQHSPEPKATRARSSENRSSDNSLRRSLRGSEKESTGSADQSKKRRRKSSKGDEKYISAIRKMLQDGTNSESQTIVDDDDETPDDVTASNTEVRKPMEDTDQDTPNIIVTEAVVETNISENLVANAAKESATNDDDEVVENSQANPSDSARNRKSIISALQFAKTNSAEEIQAEIHIEEPAINEPLPRSSSPLSSLVEPMEPDVLDKDTLTDEKTPHDDSDETFLDISAIRPQPIEEVPSEDADKKAPEENKTNGTSAMPKTDRMFNFSSPKNPAKRFTKPRGFAVHGRAAHMLGLVTKLAVLEKDGEIDKNNIEEDILTNRKNKMKENESEQLSAKRDRPIVFKDPERMGSPGGSRQEKIFNNMKSADYALSPPAKLFGNLKNNGEKVSPKMGKMNADATASSLESDASSVRDDDEDISQSSERDELPMLEWSSANPPSLTASPSASILKRIRQIATEAENDGSPNKSLRKRVSFADPPVSKEMGYEIASGGSPLKTSKFTSRSLFDRKNSPLRLKQSRFKMIQIDPEKTEKDEEPQPLSSNEVDMDCERDNAMLVKIAEALEDTSEFRTTDNIPETIVTTRLELNSDNEVEIGESLKFDVNHEKVASVDASAQKAGTSSKKKDVTIDDIETQEDLFNSSDEKNESNEQFANRSVDISKEEFPTSTQNSTIDSLKLNVTGDSVIGSLTNLEGNEHNKSECLEDTVDVRNMTGLNSSANSDEMFCEKPLRTSTEAPDGISQMDTLPVTDSILASLPISQDSQDSTQANMELAQPQLLDAIDPIYPSLVNCENPIDGIVSSLTNPLWIKNLSKHLASRGISTVGDLARLSEREIVRIPLKGSPKVEFVRKVLRRFEENLPSSPKKQTVAKMNVNSEDFLALVSDKDISMNIDEHTDTGDLPTLDVSAVTLPSQEPTSDSVGNNKFGPPLPQAIRRTSTTIANDAVDPSICSVLQETSAVSQISTINLSSDTFLGTMVSVGTSTDTLPKPPSKSVGSQMALEELLDEIDVKLVLQSAVKRSSAETLLTQYKSKMGHMSETELGKETMRMLAVDSKATHSDTTLKAACRACGVNKVLLRLPDIFSNDKQFFAKVLSAYRKKIDVSDWIEALNFEDIKNEVCKKCSPSELAEMLSKVLKQEENDVTNQRISSLSEILKNMPLDVIISHTVANNELIPSSIVLDIALRNNEIDVVTNEIESQYPEIAQKIADRKMTPQNITSHIESISMPKDNLLSIHKAVCAKLSPEDLLDAYHEAMKLKLNDNLG